jgi:DNA polymerase I-like protein with 3'-5' exonuclease and polymerase domains
MCSMRAHGTHGMDALSERWLGHKPISYKEVAGSGKKRADLRHGRYFDRATAYAAEGRRCDAAALARAEAALLPPTA